MISNVIQKICQLRDGTMPYKTFVRNFHFSNSYHIQLHLMHICNFVEK